MLYKKLKIKILVNFKL